MTERETVTEAVEAAARALFTDEWRDAPGDWAWESTDDDDKAYWYKSARAALEAALPLIVAGERARQAEAQATADERAREEIHRMYVESGGPTDKLREVLDAYRANERAAAIRADKGGE